MDFMRLFKKNSIAKAFLICLLILSLIGCMAGCNQKTDSGASLPQSEGQAEKTFRKQMADASVTDVVVSDNLVLASPVEVAGNKVISGEGSITAIAKDKEGNYMFVVPSGSALTVKGNVVIDAAGVMGGIHVQKDATLTLEENAAVKHASAKAANAMVEGKLLVNGGSFADANGHNIYNKNETVISGGTVTGSGEKFAGVYNEGKLTQDDGSICAAYYNVVSVEGSSYTFNKGSVTKSVHNAIVIEKGASLKITSKDASITDAGHRGIYLSGEAVIDQVTMKNGNDTLIKITETGKLTFHDGMLSNAGYHGIDNAGTLLVKGGTINNSYSCGIVNTGSLEMTGGAVMNNANKGILNKLNGVAKVLTEDVYLAGNRFAIGNEDNAYFELTQAAFSGSTNANIYAYGGEMYIHDITLAKSASNNVRVVAAKVTMEDVEILGNATSGSSTMHGILLEGGEVTAKNVTVIGTTGNGIRNKGGKFVGNNIALSSIGNHGVTNTNQDFTGREGVVIIDGLTVDTVRYNNVLAENGTITISNAVLKESGTNNIKVSGGILNLNNVDIQGNIAEAADNVHGIYTTGGTINGKKVTVTNTRGAALRVAGEEAVVSMNGFTAETLSNASVSITEGTVSITDGVMDKTKSNNIRIDGGALTLKNVTINGHHEGAPSNVHALYATGGKVTAEDLTVTASNGAGVRNNGGDVKITGLKVDNVGTHTLYLSNDKSITTITDAALGAAPSNNVNILGGELTLTDSEILGHHKDGARDIHGILTSGGKVNLEDVTISGTTGSGIRNKGAVLNGKNVTIHTFGGYNALSNAASDSGLCGELNIDGLTVTNSVADQNDLVILASQCDGKVNISNAKFATNTETVTTQANVLVDAGTVVLDNIEMEVVTSNSFRVNGGNVTLKNATIPGHAEGAPDNVNAFYTIGGTTLLENITITNPTGDGLRVNVTADEEGKVIAEPTVTANNVTVTGAGRNSMWVSGGEITVDGATFSGLKSDINNVLVNGGKATLINVVSDKVNKNNNICVNSGELNLQNVQILGHNEGAATSDHGLYANGGKLIVDGVSIENTAGSGIRVDNNAVLDAKDVKISVTGQHGIRLGDAGEEASNNLKVTINGLTIENTKTNNILHENGELTVKNAVLHESTSNNIKLIGGKLNLEDVQVLGHHEGVRHDNHGIFIEITKNSEATLNAKDILVSNTAGAALRNKGGNVTVNGLVISNIGANTLISNVDHQSVPGVMSISRLGVSEGCDHAQYVVHNQTADTKNPGKFTNELTVKDSIMLLDSKTVGVFAEYGKVTVENSVISGAMYAIQNKAELTVNGGSLHNNGWSVRNEEGAKATLSGGFYYGNKEGTLPSDIYNGGELTIENITVGYNKKGAGRPGVIYQAATADPIIMKGNKMGLHTAAKKLQLAAEEWVRKWGAEKNLIIKCDSVADALEAERFFDPGIEDPKLFVSAVGSNLELTTQPGGNFIIQIGEERFASFADALKYIAENDSFNTTEGGFKKAATIQIIDSYLHFENVVIPKGYNLTLVDDGKNVHVVAYDSNLTGDMFTVGEGAQLNLKVTGNTNPDSGLIFSGSTDSARKAAVFCVDGGNIKLLNDLSIEKAYYGIRLVDGKFDADGKTICTAGTYGINAIGGELKDAILSGSGTAVCVNDENADAMLTNITINGYGTGIYGNAGKLTIDGLTSDAATYNVNVNGTADITVSDATFGKTTSNNVVVNGGKLTLTDVTIIGHVDGASGTIHAVMAQGGETTLNNVTITHAKNSGIRVKNNGTIVNMNGGSIVNVGNDAINVTDDVVLNSTGNLTISHAAANGVNAAGSAQITIENLTISDVKTRNIIVTGTASVTVESGSFGTTQDAMNIETKDNSTLNLSNATVTHTSTVEWAHGDTDKINTPVHVMGNSKVTLDNVTLNGGKYGIRVHTSQNVTLNNVTIKDSTQFGMWLQASPKVTVTGELKISGTGSNGIQVNSGTLDASNATKVEITDAGANGLDIRGTANVKNLAVTDAANCGIYTSGTVNLSGATTMSGIAKDGIHVAGSGRVIGVAGSSVTITGCTNGLVLNSANASASLNDLTVKDPTTAGVHLGPNGGTAEITNLNIVDADKTDSNTFAHGIKIEKGEITVNGGSFDETSARTIRMYEGSTVNLTGEITMAGSGGDVIYVEKDSTLNVDDAELTIASATDNGILAHGTVNISDAKLTISSATDDGIYVDGTVNISGAADVKISNAKNGINLQTAGKLYATDSANISIQSASSTGIVTRHDGTLFEAKDDVTLSIKDIANAGISSGGGDFTFLGKSLSVSNCGTGTGQDNNNIVLWDAAADYVIRNATFGKTTDDGKNANDDGHNIEVGSGNLTLTDSVIEGTVTAGNGIQVTSGTVKLDGVTIKDCAGHGIHTTGANAKVEITGDVTIRNANYAILNEKGGSVVAEDGTKVTISDSNYGLVSYDNCVISLDEVEITALNNDAIYADGNGVTDAARTGVTVNTLTVRACNRGINVFDSGIVTIAESASITDCKTRGIAVGASGKLDASAATSVVLTDCGHHDSDNNGESNNQGMSVDGVATINNLTMKADSKNVNYHSIKLNNADAILTLTGTTNIGNAVSNNLSITYGTLNLNGDVTIGNNIRENGIVIEATAKSVNITGSLTIGGKNGGIFHRGGKLNLTDATLQCTTDNKYSVRVENTNAVVNASGKVVADIYFADAQKQNVVNGLSTGSDVDLTWASGKIPADYVAVNFVKADGTTPDADGMAASKAYISASVDDHTLTYVTLADGKTVALLDPVLVKSEADLKTKLMIAELADATTLEIDIGASFSVSEQIVLPAGMTSLTVSDKDATDSEKYTLTVASGVSPFAIADGQKLTLKDLTIGGASADAAATQIRVGTGAQLDLQNVTMQYFSNSHGAAIFVYDTGKLTASGSTFTNNKNSSNWGGAIANWGGTVEITDSVFRGNYSKNSGGAIFNYHDDGQNGAPNLKRNGSVTVTGCTFLNNTSDANGGALGMYGKGNMMSVVNCTFGELNGSNAVVNSNTAPNGDAILAQDGSTLTVNGGNFYGDDIFVRGNKNSEGVANLEGTINMTGAETSAIQVATVSGSDKFGCTVNIKGTLNITDPGTKGIFIDGKGIVNHFGELAISDDIDTGNTAGIYAQNEGKFIGVDGSKVTTSGTKMFNSVYSTGSAEVTIYGGTFGATTQNNIVAISGGTVNLYGNATANTKVTGGNHGVLADNTGTVYLEYVTISNAVNGIRANHALSDVSGKNVTIIGTTNGMSIARGTVVIENLTIRNTSEVGVGVWQADSAANVTLTNLITENCGTYAIHTTGGSANVTVKGGTLGNDGSHHVIYLNGGPMVLNDVTISNTPTASGMYELYSGAGFLTIGGAMDADIYLTSAPSNGNRAVKVNRAITGNKLTIDWAAGKYDTPAIKFNSEQIMNDSMNSMTLGSTQTTAGNLLYFHMDGTNAVATLVNKVVTSEAELNDYLAAAVQHGMTAEIKIGASFAVTEQITLPDGLKNIAISDQNPSDAEKYTITYTGDTTGVSLFAGLDSGETLSLGNLTIDGNNKANVQVPAGAILNTNNVTLQNVNNRGLDIYGTANVTGALTVDSLTTGNKYAIVVEDGGKLDASTGSVVTVNDANYGVVGYGTGAISLDTLKTGNGSIANSALWANGGNVVSVNYAEITAKGDAVYASGTVDMTIETLNVSNSNKNINAVGNAHVTVNGGTLGKSTSNNVTSGGAGSVVTLKNVSVNGATNASTHGVLAQDGDVVLENVTITSATGTDGAGIRVNRAGSTVTVTGKLEIKDVVFAISISAGEVDITGAKDNGGANSVEFSAKKRNILMDGGTVKVTNATLNATSEHNVHPRNDAATVTLTDCEILGGGQYGVLAENGHAVLNRVSFSGCKDAIRSNQATSTVVATDVTINNSTRYGISISNGEITINGATFTNSANHDIYVENANGTMSIGGKVKAEVYFNVADVLNVTAVLTDSITVDWATAPAGAVITFASEDVMNASKDLITLGSTQTTAGNLLYFHMDGTNAVATLVNKVVTSEAELNDYLAASAYYGTSAEVLIGSSFTVADQIELPAGLTSVTISDKDATDSDSYTITYNGAAELFKLNNVTELTVSAITIDGNGVGRAVALISVPTGVEVDFTDVKLQGVGTISNSATGIIYANGGTLNLTGATIGTATKSHALYVASGTVVMDDCTIESQNGKVAVYVVGGNTVIQNNSVIEGSSNQYTVLIKSSANLEIKDSVVHGSNGGTTLETDAGYTGILKLTNAVVEGNQTSTEQNAIKLNAGTLIASNLTIRNSGATAVRIAKGTFEATNLTIEDSGKNGMQVSGGTVTINGLEIKNSAARAISIYGGIMTVKNAVLKNAGAYEIIRYVDNGTLNLENVTIGNTPSATGMHQVYTNWSNLNLSGEINAEIYYDAAKTLNVTGNLTGDVTVDWVAAPTGAAISFKDAATLTASRGYITLGATQATADKTLAYGETDATLVAFTEITSWADLSTAVSALNDGDKAFYKVTGDSANWAASSSLAIPSGVEVTLIGDANSPAIVASTGVSPFTLASGDVLTLENLTVGGASADAKAGQTVVPSGASVYLKNSVIQYCQSATTDNETGSGGAFNVKNGAYLSAVNTTFNGNASKNKWGGAIGLWGGKADISDCTFTNNTATASGGAIMVYKKSGVSSSLTVSDSIFTGNTATVNGGAIAFWGNGTSTVTNCEFTNNSATQLGGAIHVSESGTNVTITGSNFTNNSVSSNGGAICAADGTNVTINSSCFTQNSAVGNGGAISAESVMSIDGCQFIENECNGEGAGINLPTGKTLNISNCVFTGNVTHKAAGNSNYGYGDIRVADSSDGNGVFVSGKFVGKIWMNQEDYINITGALTSDSDLVVDWRVGQIKESTTGVAIKFASQEIMEQSQAQIHIGEDASTTENYAFHYATSAPWQAIFVTKQ